MGFKRDIAFGKKAESLVQNLFNNRGITCIKSENKEVDLVIQINFKQIFLEVKLDLMSEKTGNIAIEYFNHKSMKPSGITSSKSNFYIYVLPDKDLTTIWMVKTEVLRDFLDKNVGKMVTGGDNNSCMVLYPKDKVLSIFERIDNCDDLLLKNLLEI